jgi:hypothetical protein
VGQSRRAAAELMTTRTEWLETACRSAWSRTARR